MRLGRGVYARTSEPPAGGSEAGSPSGAHAAAADAADSAQARPNSIAERYEVRQQLGRGGMAVVYRVYDAQSGRELALKQLLPQRDPRDARTVAALFEREFHTLAQLAHPRVIEVYDFGVDAGAAYYTMELLDGGDLRERCPVPWRDTCRIMFDVCSSLALLHSRRLVHRDISPRNVRCTAGGAAKLIDFGALVPMGAGGHVVGTPAFVAPEVLHRSHVDGRTDLFSLGATFYYALLGQPPYPASDFSDLAEAWSHKPPLPSHVNAEIPAALDGLVMSLLSLEPAQRPRSAFEVMQKLSALAGIEDREALQVARAYLTTPGLVGRDDALSAVREQLSAAGRGCCGAVLIGAEAGLGRSRVLDAAVLDAKTLGATVLRADGEALAQPLATAHALLEQALELLGERARSRARALPGVSAALFAAEPDEPAALRSASAWQADPAPVIDAACALLLELAREQLLVIAIDDAHQLDDPTCSLLATLADRAQQARLSLLLTADSAALAQPAPALQLLVARSTALALSPLSAEQTQELLGSLFGDVPNVALVSQRVHQIARGKPREIMELAQHLVDKRVIAYHGGSWALPAELDASKLPDSAAAALVERVVGLSPLARAIVEAQALSVHPAFTRDEYCLLCAPEAAQRVDDAIAELLAHQVLRSDGRVHVLSHGSRSAAFTAHLGGDALRERHRALAELYVQLPERAPAAVHHLFECGQVERAVELMMTHLATVDDERAGLFRVSDMNAGDLASLFERALAAHGRLGRPWRERAELLRYLTTLGVVADADVFARAAPLWLAQLSADSGLDHYRADRDAPDAMTRLKRAFDHASARYAATPELERGYPPAEAIRLLVHYVVVAIAVGARTRNAQLMASLAGLLEPFVALSPLIEAMWQNALATWEVNCGCLGEQAHARVTELYDRLADVSGADLHNVRSIRNALAYCAGAIEAGMGRVSAMKWADVLDKDNLQLVNAMHVRKVVRLQQGDAEGAERYRRQAELLAARAVWRQMFAGTAMTELAACARAHDLTGVQRALSEITRFAERLPGWVPARWLGEGHLQRLRGNLAGAAEAYRECIALSAPDPSEPWRAITTWPGAVAGAMQVLLEQGQCEQAVAMGEHALSLAAERELGTAMHEVSRVLALAEARVGRCERACERLDELIAAQREREISGLWLGASYETRARIAIAAGDSESVERYSLLTAREYRHGQGSPLGALYERLIEDARKAGVRVLPQLSDFQTRMIATGLARRGSAHARVTQALRSALGPRERAARALELICEARGARGGHLWLASGSDLSLAASRSVPEPDETLLERAREYLREQLEEQPEHTTTPGEVDSDATSDTLTLADGAGTPHHPVLLKCVVGGTPLCAGIALIALESGPASVPRMVPADVIAAISSLLIEAGHTQGTRTRW